MSKVQMGNPVEEQSSDLLTLDTNDNADFFSHEKQLGTSKDLQRRLWTFLSSIISCQSRECVLQEFFEYENQSAPASWSGNGKLHLWQNSQLIDILKVKVTMPESQPIADSIILDGSALVHERFATTQIKNLREAWFFTLFLITLILQLNEFVQNTAYFGVFFDQVPEVENLFFTAR